MTKLNLSAPTMQKITLDTSGKNMHNTLKNLDFESSGHTGFQKELTKEQICNINAIGDIETALDNIIAIQTSLIGGESA